MNMLKMKRGDVLLIVFLVLLGSAWLLLRQALESRETVDPATLRAEIKVDGESFRSVPLGGGEETIEIHSEYGHNTLKVFDGESKWSMPIVRKNLHADGLHLPAWGNDHLRAEPRVRGGGSQRYSKPGRKRRRCLCPLNFVLSSRPRYPPVILPVPPPTGSPTLSPNPRLGRRRAFGALEFPKYAPP